MAKKYEIESQRIGRGETKDGKEKSAEGQVLNRVVRRTDRGVSNLRLNSGMPS